MATSGALLRRTCQMPKSLRHLCTSVAATTHHRQPPQNHRFQEPNTYLGSWEPPKDPKEAEARLALLRRQYAKQVKDVRREYIKEVELMRLEQQRKDEAKREAINVATEERNKLKAAEAKVRAEERKVAEAEFRRLLMKEKAEKLENWRMKEKARGNKNEEKRELLHRKSSLWVDKRNLEKTILEAVVDIRTL